MALEYVRIEDPGEPQVTIDRHLYITEDGTRVVEENDPAGRRLWAAPGDRRARKEAERLGAISTPAAPEAKQAPPSANKQRRPVADKSGAEDKHTAG